MPGPRSTPPTPRTLTKTSVREGGSAAAAGVRVCLPEAMRALRHRSARPPNRLALKQSPRPHGLLVCAGVGGGLEGGQRRGGSHHVLRSRGPLFRACWQVGWVGWWVGWWVGGWVGGWVGEWLGGRARGARAIAELTSKSASAPPRLSAARVTAGGFMRPGAGGGPAAAAAAAAAAASPSPLRQSPGNPRPRPPPGLPPSSAAWEQHFALPA